MCGIAATCHYARRGPVDRDQLRTLRDGMRARGPDDDGLWVSEDERVGLAHRRLSIIDLSPRGAQPMVNGDGSLRVVYNGEIYNYQALRDDLEARGYAFQSDSDTELLLHLYAEKGRDMTEDLRGMYAFALWDANRGGLFCARDPYGIKPLYVADTGVTFHVASQVRALREIEDVDTGKNSAGHVGYFLWPRAGTAHALRRHPGRARRPHALGRRAGRSEGAVCRHSGGACGGRFLRAGRVCLNKRSADERGRPGGRP